MIAISLLAMPVSYRGGAEQIHPHVFFQVWIDAKNGSFTHHHSAHGIEHVHQHASAPQTQETGTGKSDAPSLIASLIPSIQGVSLVASAITEFVVPRDALFWRELKAFPQGRRLRPDLPPPRFAGSI